MKFIIKATYDLYENVCKRERECVIKNGGVPLLQDDYPDKVCRYEIDIPSIEKLSELTNEIGPIIITKDRLEIYNSYRE